MISTKAQNLIDEIKAGQNLFLDTETVGLYGVAVLIQWQVDNGEIVLWEVFKESFADTIAILEAMTGLTLIGFNLTFDGFHIVKLNNLLMEFVRQFPDLSQQKPEDHIHMLELVEEDAIENALGWKPVAVCDLMLQARKGKYQALMSRSNVTIRKVPTPLAYALAQELEARIELDDIYFARYRKKQSQWGIDDIEDDPYFKNVVLRFAASGSLKALAAHALGAEDAVKFEEIELDKRFRPHEIGYAPTARASREDQPGCLAWPDQVKHHIEHWHSHEGAREYGRKDIVYTKGLWEHLDQPEADDDDSVLAIQVANVRWRGLDINLEGVKRLRGVAKEKVDAREVNTNSPVAVRAYLGEVMDEMEKLLIVESTRKELIKEIATWKEEDDNPEAARRAQHILDVRDAGKEVELYDKLILARRFHPSLNIIGTKSSRMSGTDGLNPQAIKKVFEVRDQFTMAPEGYELLGGDFDSFELYITDAIYQDPALREFLTGDKKLHGYLATYMYEPMTYDEVIETSGTKDDKYGKGKSAVYGILYGGTDWTLINNLGLSPEAAQRTMEGWAELLPGVSSKVAETASRFLALTQDEATRKITWKEPDDYIETMDGFRRYFTLENKIAKALFDLANKPPKSWKDCKIKVARRDRLQTAGGATQSALYGAAFGILGANARAAGNHQIQSQGSTTCKRLQRKIWDTQPVGVSPLRVLPINIHDEIMCPATPDHADTVIDTVNNQIQEESKKVPLIAMGFDRCSSWATK